MREYLLKLPKIRQKSNDVSEYANFCTAVIQYLREESDHHLYVEPLVKALESVKNTNLIEVFYKIAAAINPNDSDPFIPYNILNSHFNNEKTRSFTLPYLQSRNIHSFDEEIEKDLVSDPNFISEDLFEYVKSNKHLSREFMNMRNSEYLSKQLDFITNSNIGFNLEYFFLFLGCEFKLIAFKTFEALSLAKANGIFTTPVKFDVKFKIESAVHFLIFATDFLLEKNEILECINQKNAQRLCEIFEKYCDGFMIEDNSLKNLKPCVCESIVFREEQYSNLTNFDFLFKKLRNDICDCPEL